MASCLLTLKYVKSYMSVLYYQKSNNKVYQSFAHVEFNASLTVQNQLLSTLGSVTHHSSLQSLCKCLRLREYAHHHGDVMLLRHTGHVSITATRFAQLSQKRAYPQGTSANPSRHKAAASAAVCGAVDVVVGAAAVDWLSSPSSSSLSLSAGCNAAV